MFKPARNTKKASRAREMIAAIYHIPLSEVRNDRTAVNQMYENLQGLGFEWVADEQEWLNPTAIDPAKAQVMSFIVGSATDDPEMLALTLMEALEKQGYKTHNTMVIVDPLNPSETIVRVEMVK